MTPVSPITAKAAKVWKPQRGALLPWPASSTRPTSARWSDTRHRGEIHQGDAALVGLGPKKMSKTVS